MSFVGDAAAGVRVRKPAVNAHRAISKSGNTKGRKMKLAVPKRTRSAGARWLVAALTAAVVIGPASAQAASAPSEIVLSDVAVTSTFTNVRATMVKVTTSDSAFILDLASGRRFSPEGAFGNSSGTYIVRPVAGGSYVAQRVSDGVDTPIVAPVIAGWRFSIFDVSEDGTRVAWNALDPTGTRIKAFLASVDGTLQTPPEGLGIAHGKAVSVDALGPGLWWGAYSETDHFDSVTRFDYVTNTSTTINRPPDARIDLGEWWPSWDLEWAGFVADAGIFVRNLSSGATYQVPVDRTLVDQYDVGPNGRVALIAHPTDGLTGLYVWQPGFAKIVPVAAPIPPRDSADFQTVVNTTNPAQRILSSDGNSAVFTVTGHDLSGNGPMATRIYRVDLTGFVDPARLPAGASVCADATGASPGQFVGVNITPPFAGGAGWGVLHSSDNPAGSTSSVNFVAGPANPNVAFARVGANGKVCYTNSPLAASHLVLDEMIVGDANALAQPTPTGSVRLIDTRDGDRGVLAPGESICVAAVGAQAGDIVGVNITPVGASAPGYGTLHSSDNPAGETSSVNFGAADTNPNMGFVKVGADGKICYTNSPLATSHVVLDEMIVGKSSAFAAPSPTGAVRIVDTREGRGGATLAPNVTICAPAVGAQPGDFVAVNLTPTRSSGPGDGVLHSSDDPAGGTSSVNFVANSANPNLGFAKVGTDGKICFTNSNSATTDIVLDEVAVMSPAAFAPPSPTGAVRILDTRS